MTSCVEPVGEDVEFCDGEHQQGGFQNQFAIGFWNQVLTWPVFGASSNAQATAAEKKLSTTGNITFKTGFKFSKVTCLNDTIDLETKGIDGSTGVETTFKVKIQNTPKNQAIVDSWKGSRLIAVMNPNEGDAILLGRATHYVTAKVDTAKQGFAKDANKSIEVEFSFMPKRPVSYSGTVSFTEAV